MSDIANQPIEELHFTVRTFHGLHRVGIYTIGELLEHDEQSLMAIPNFGVKSLAEVYRALHYRGLFLNKRCPTCGRPIPLPPEEAAT